MYGYAIVCVWIHNSIFQITEESELALIKTNHCLPIM